MNTSFNDLIADMRQRRPSEKTAEGLVFFVKDHPVRLIDGEMEGIHWVDIHVGLNRFRMDGMIQARKVLQANLEIGSATPIPSWFAIDKQDRIVYINRLDWRHIEASVLDEHIGRCIDFMNEALAGEGL